VVSDDDAEDRSEEQFAASLDEQFGSATLQEAAQERVEEEELVAEAAIANVETGSQAQYEDYRALATARAAAGIERRMAEERALEQQGERWRDEIASRVEGYRQKRSRKQLAGEFSMRFDWEPVYPARGILAATAAEPAWESESDIEISDVTGAQAYSAYEPLTVGEQQGSISEHEVSRAEQQDLSSEMVDRKPPVAEPAPLARRLRNSNLIEFPRLPFMPPPPDELAEPVMDKPRILDVPEEIVQEMAEERTPLADIALESQAEEPPRQPDFDVPLQVAALPLRFVAAMVDAVLVLIAAGIFIMIVQLISPGLPRNRMTLATAVFAPSILWAIYQYVFLVYGAATPGMRVTHLEVRGFTADRASCGRRRLRALAMLLSCMPLGLGIAWAFADEDMLCWHDRITRTYLARR
jgi:RDD family